MAHLTENQLQAHLLDGEPLEAQAAEHLAHCPQCQQEQQRLADLLQELRIAQASQPSPEKLASYYRLFEEVQQQKQPGWLDRVAQAIRLALQWDSREEALALGLRQASPVNYRMLFSADQADVELLVESLGRTRRLEGDVLPLDPEGVPGPILVELWPRPEAAHKDRQAPIREHMTTSDPTGRFRFEHVPPGLYTMLLTPVNGPLMSIERLEIV